MVQASTDNCITLLQRRHAVEFDIDIAVKHIEEWEEKLHTLMESESDYESQLAVKTTSLNESQRLYNYDVSSAKSIQKRLVAAEANVTALADEIKLASRTLTNSDHVLKNLTRDIDILDSRIFEAESASRKSDLALQMLKNDIDASNKTLVDSLDLANQSRSRVVKLRAALENAAFRVSKIEDIYNLMRSEETRTESDLAQAKHDLEAKKRLRVNQLRTLGDLHQQDSQLRLKMDSDETETIAQNKSLSSYNNTTVLTLQNTLQLKIQAAQALQAELASVKSDKALFESKLNSTMSIPVVSDSVSEELRKSIRESKILLSKEGYGDRFSLIQMHTPGASVSKVNIDIHLFEDRSRILSLEDQLRKIADEEEVTRSRLRDAMLRSADLQTAYSRGINAELEDRKELHILQQQELNATLELESILGNISRISVDIRRLNDADIRQKANITNILSQLTDGRNLLRTTNSSYNDEQTTLKNTESDVHIKRMRLAQSEKQQAEIRVHLQETEEGLEKYGIDVKHKRDESVKLESAIETDSAKLENLRKQHTDALADTAQLTRRLQDWNQQMDAALMKVRTDEAEINQLEVRISNVLTTRSDLNAKLQKKTEALHGLQAEVSMLKSRELEGQCNV